ncbi:hypothetical protein [Spartinivicinus poritis]|uniref:Uncharacterized protein n=1 Tax=Spartinivicinus poritis TaxID=2994640 RepID=A0ABT5UFJ3_9GAMM|nr:hypothetical protein [Spartinivicinus sp. A2-2]MDE1464233.1 hypothetical protein [Spartinivicinus sp. A2-2]
MMNYSAPADKFTIEDKYQLISTINDICLLFLNSKLTKADFRITTEGAWPANEGMDLPYLHFENIHNPQVKTTRYIIESKAVFNFFHQYPEIADEIFNYELRALARSFCVPGSVWHCLGFSYFSFDFLFSSRINEYSRQVSFPPDYQLLTDKQFPYYACLQLVDEQHTGVVLGNQHNQLVFKLFEDYKGAAPEWLPATGAELYVDDTSQNTIVLFKHDLLLTPEHAVTIPDAINELVADISEEAINAHFSHLLLNCTPHKLNITAKANNVVPLSSAKVMEPQVVKSENETTTEKDEPTTEGLLTVFILAICLAISAFLFETYAL